jgi:phytoene dehydrogenase-like protein
VDTPSRTGDVADAVVVGAGINGLVAAAELAIGGWSVVLIDANDRLGGFIATDELTEPGYLHDTYSSFHPLFISGAAYGSLGTALHRHGMEYLNTDGWVTGSVSERGVVLAHRNPIRTIETFDVPSDRDAYLGMLDEFGAYAPQILAIMGSELTPWRLARIAASTLRTHKVAGTMQLLRSLAQSGRGYVRERFSGWEVDALWVPWLLHAGLGPDSASGSLTLKLLPAATHQFGMPVVRGGQGRFVDAFAGLFRELGVALVLGEAVTGIDVENRRAVGVRLGDRRVRARRAVVVSMAPGQLYPQMLPAGAVPACVVDQARRYRPGRAVMQIHVALDGPVRWTDARLGEVPVVHVSNGADSTGIACSQALAGLLPAEPTVVVGQQHILDPSRVPDGKALLWLQLQEVPSTPRADSAGELDTSAGWDEALQAGYADRVLRRIEAFAPGLRGLVRRIFTISPQRLEAVNRNAIAGDGYAGCTELDQSLFWRPIANAPHHRTPVQGLWQIGASTHPGPGLGGTSGHLAAQQLLARRRR